MQRLRSVLAGAGFVGLCATTGYFATDVAESALLLRAGSRLALDHVEANEELKQQLGSPVVVGSWFNASVGVRPGRNAADCNVELIGIHRKASAMVQMSRKPSAYRSILLYHLLGSGEWDVVAVNAMVPKGPGSGSNATGPPAPRPAQLPASQAVAPSTTQRFYRGKARNGFEMDDHTQMLSQVSMMNKISTGNTTLDLILCFLLPLLLRQLVPYVERLRAWWQTQSIGGSKRWSREISFVKKDMYYYGTDDSAPNNLLQQAILMYLATKQELCSQLCEAQLQLAKKSVQALEEETHSDDDADSYDSLYDDYAAADTAQQLKRFQVNTVPPLNTWVRNVEPGLDFMRKEDAIEKGDGKRVDTATTFFLQSNTSSTLIDDFVNRAYDHYKKINEEKAAAGARYLYTPAASPDSDDKKGLFFKRYELTDEKTFDSFWHPDKGSLLRLTDHFINKTGKYSIVGYPHKLGLLLHGPPGTGKTSLVKALAHYTGRSVIAVPLSQIETNQQLQDIIFDQNFNVAGEDLPIWLPYSKSIFLLEDVDAACEVVNKRSDSSPRPRPASMRKSPRRKSPSPPDASDSDGELVPKVSGPDLPSSKSLLAAKLWEDKDKLNLAGLLNVLDGVVECPGRIVIMTTNHPDRLDPALIRPGRISKKVYMGYLGLQEALAMAAHYGGCELTARQIAAFSLAFKEDEVSPAEMEMLCCDADSIEELVELLRKREDQR